MKVGILGSGMVAQALGSKIVALGHEVIMGTRSPEKLDGWRAALGGKPVVGTFAEAAAGGELLINATSGMASIEVLKAAGAAHLSGKILIDLANPLDFSRGMPPTLSVSNTDSLGEQIQRAFPDTKVVKTLNTVHADLMVDPQQLAGGDHVMFLCGNDPAAKAEVEAILREWFGWSHVIDLGDMNAARGTEMYLPLWLSLMSALGTVSFNINVVK